MILFSTLHRSIESSSYQCPEKMGSSSVNPLAAYSLVRSVSLGTGQQQILYISGTTARQPDGQFPLFGQGYDDSIASAAASNDGKAPATIQTELILSKIAFSISDATDGKFGLESVVELNIFVANLERDFASMNDAFNRIISGAFEGREQDLPAHTCVQVGAMPPDRRTLVEINAVAVVGI